MSMPHGAGQDTWSRHVAAPLTLFVLAPLIGEVLFGAVPLSLLPFGLLGLIGLYGGGALLVREVVRRRRLPGRWLVIVGLAYGIIEEGTVVQSIFDQQARGLDFLGYYGHWAGVNWIWALFIVPYHAVFSIAVPVALAELWFLERHSEAWLGPAGLVAAAAAFILNAALLAVYQTHLFTPHAPDVSLGANIAAAVIALAMVAAAFRATPAAGRAARGAASPSRVWWTGFVCGLAWFIGFRVLVIGSGTNMPAAVALAAGGAIAAAIVLALARLSPPVRDWTTASTLALVSGALPTSWLLGFLIAAVSGGNPVLNLAGQVLFGALLFAGLARVRRRVAASPA
jgi:hypothetical protein